MEPKKKMKQGTTKTKKHDNLVHDRIVFGLGPSRFALHSCWFPPENFRTSPNKALKETSGFQDLAKARNFHLAVLLKGFGTPCRLHLK